MKRIIAIAIVVLLVLSGFAVSNVEADDDGMYDGRTVSGIEYKYSTNMAFDATIPILNFKIIAPNSNKKRVIKPCIEMISYETGESVSIKTQPIIIEANPKEGKTVIDQSYQFWPDICFSGDPGIWYYYLLTCPIDGEEYSSEDEKRVTPLSMEEIQSKKYPVTDDRYGIRFIWATKRETSISSGVSVGDINDSYATIVTVWSDICACEIYSTKMYYEWGTTEQCSNKSKDYEVSLGDEMEYVVSGLSPDSTYYCRAVVWNHHLKEYVPSDTISFETLSEGEGIHDGYRGKEVSGIRYWYDCTTTPINAYDYEVQLRITAIAPSTMAGRIIEPSISIREQSKIDELYGAWNFTLDPIAIPEGARNKLIAVKDYYFTVTPPETMCPRCLAYYYSIKCPVEGEHYQDEDQKLITYISENDTVPDVFFRDHKYVIIFGGLNEYSYISVKNKRPIDIGSTTATLRGSYSVFKKQHIRRKVVFIMWNGIGVAGETIEPVQEIWALPGEDFEYTVSGLIPDSAYNFSAWIQDNECSFHDSKTSLMGFRTKQRDYKTGSITACNLQVKDGNSYRYVKNNEILPSRTKAKIVWKGSGENQKIRIEMCYDVSKDKTLSQLMPLSEAYVLDEKVEFRIYDSHRFYFEDICSDNNWKYRPKNLYFRIVKYNAAEEPEDTDILFKMPLKFGIKK